MCGTCGHRPKFKGARCKPCYRKRERELHAQRRATGWVKPDYEDSARKRERTREYQAANPERHRTTNNNTYARRLGAVGRYSFKDWLALLRHYNGRCAYCGDAATTRDHAVPLSRGGSNFIGNIVPACLSCNTAKKDRLPIEWRLMLNGSNSVRARESVPTY